MIVVVTAFNPKTHRWECSHGVDYDTMQGVCLPPETPYSIGAEWDEDMMEYVLYERTN